MQQFYRNGKQIEWDSDSPVITCLMSVYNGETYLREAMDSILDQTYTNFEFLIINDGSTDSSVSIIESYEDPRIRLVHNEVNIGLTKSLNKGIDLAKGEYIARMDADDVSMSERFERQIKIIRGTDLLIAQKILSNDILPNELHFKNIVIHSSVMFKKIIKNKVVYYDSNLKYAQDYALWLNDFYGKIIFTKNLVVNRTHQLSLTYRNRKEQFKIANEILFLFYKKINLNLSDSERDILIRLRSGDQITNQYMLHTYFNILNKMYEMRFFNNFFLKKVYLFKSLVYSRSVSYKTMISYLIK